MRVPMKLAGICLALAARSCCSLSVGSPVERVVHLLEDLKKSIEKDGAKEEQIYNRFACWCENAANAKAKAIETAEDDIKQLGIIILKLKGKVATLTSEIEALGKDLESNGDAEAQATGLRQKQNAAFEAESEEMKQALAALEKAIAALIKGTTPEGASLLQQSYTASTEAAVLAAFASPSKSSERAVLLQAMAAFKDKKYAPQSMTVQGMLSEMYGTFSADLEKATKLEASQNEAFEDLIASLDSGKASMEAQKQAKEKAKADAEAELAAATQDYDDTTRQKDADIAFFDATAHDCRAKNQEWTTRKSLRAEELAGVVKAIGILSTDDARELFGKAIKPGLEAPAPASFLQVGRHVASLQSAQENAYKALKTQATKLHSLRLAQLAVTVRTSQAGIFVKVISAIDTMVETLKKEGADDVAKKDQCTEEYAKSASDVADVKWRIEKSKAKRSQLKQALKENTKEQGEVGAQIKTLLGEINDMKDARNEENAAFLQAKKDDEAAVALLEQARAALSAYYTDNGMSLSLLKRSSNSTDDMEVPGYVPPPPEATFSEKDEHHGESKGIVAIMTYLIEDLYNEIHNGVANEAEAQTSFMEELGKATALKKALLKKQGNLGEVNADLSEDLVSVKDDLKNQRAELKDEKKYKASITDDCDWILGAFDERAEKRALEQDALLQAKAYLSGAQSDDASGTFLQRRM